MAPPISTLGLQKAAILMVLLGEESASHIYRNLPEGDVERLTRRIAELEHFKPETAMSVLEEYYQLSLTQGYLAEGGPDYAQKLLVKSDPAKNKSNQRNEMAPTLLGNPLRKVGSQKVACHGAARHHRCLWPVD